MHITALPHRGVLEITGEDKASFLQGLITNDIHLVSSTQAIYAVLLTPQGRYLYDFFISENNGSYLLDAEASRLEDLLKKLTLYKLRSKTTLKLRPDLNVYAFWGSHGNFPFSTTLDPRLPALGGRMIGATQETTATPDDYDLHRLRLGIPEGGKDLIPEKSILLENGLDELNAISWTKGCYMGQELTARTKYRGLVRKRLFPVNIEGEPAVERTEIFLNGESVGEMRSHNQNQGLALLRIDAVKVGEPLVCGNGQLKPYRPIWMRREES